MLSYFLSKKGLCDLTVMVTDRPDAAPEGDEIPTLTTIRFQATIDGGKAAHVDTAVGGKVTQMRRAIGRECTPLDTAFRLVSYILSVGGRRLLRDWMKSLETSARSMTTKAVVWVTNTVPGRSAKLICTKCWKNAGSKRSTWP